MFQLGSREKPCQVMFGLSDRFDLGKPWHSISITCIAPEALAALGEFVKEDKNGIKFVSVKISDKTAVTRGDAVLLAVIAESWRFAGKYGVCLRAKAVEKLERKAEAVVFI